MKISQDKKSKNLQTFRNIGSTNLMTPNIIRQTPITQPTSPAIQTAPTGQRFIDDPKRQQSVIVETSPTGQDFVRDPSTGRSELVGRSRPRTPTPEPTPAPTPEPTPAPSAQIQRTRTLTPPPKDSAMAALYTTRPELGADIRRDMPPATDRAARTRMDELSAQLGRGDITGIQAGATQRETLTDIERSGRRPEEGFFDKSSDRLQEMFSRDRDPSETVIPSIRRPSRVKIVEEDLRLDRVDMIDEDRTRDLIRRGIKAAPKGPVGQAISIPFTGRIGREVKIDDRTPDQKKLDDISRDIKDKIELSAYGNIRDIEKALTSPQVFGFIPTETLSDSDPRFQDRDAKLFPNFQRIISGGKTLDKRADRFQELGIKELENIAGSRDEIAKRFGDEIPGYQTKVEEFEEITKDIRNKFFKDDENILVNRFQTLESREKELQELSKQVDLTSEADVDRYNTAIDEYQREVNKLNKEIDDYNKLSKKAENLYTDITTVESEKLQPLVEQDESLQTQSEDALERYLSIVPSKEKIQDRLDAQDKLNVLRLQARGDIESFREDVTFKDKPLTRLKGEKANILNQFSLGVLGVGRAVTETFVAGPARQLSADIQKGNVKDYIFNPIGTSASLVTRNIYDPKTKVLNLEALKGGIIAGTFGVSAGFSAAAGGVPVAGTSAAAAGSVLKKVGLGALYTGLVAGGPAVAVVQDKKQIQSIKSGIASLDSELASGNITQREYEITKNYLQGRLERAEKIQTTPSRAFDKTLQNVGELATVITGSTVAAKVAAPKNVLKNLKIDTTKGPKEDTTVVSLKNILAPKVKSGKSPMSKASIKRMTRGLPQKGKKTERFLEFRGEKEEIIYPRKFKSPTEIVEKKPIVVPRKLVDKGTRDIIKTVKDFNTGKTIVSRETVSNVKVLPLQRGVKTESFVPNVKFKPPSQSRYSPEKFKEVFSASGYDTQSLLVQTSKTQQLLGIKVLKPTKTPKFTEKTGRVFSYSFKEGGSTAGKGIVPKPVALEVPKGQTHAEIISKTQGRSKQVQKILERARAKQQARKFLELEKITTTKPQVQSTQTLPKIKTPKLKTTNIQKKIPKVKKETITKKKLEPQTTTRKILGQKSKTQLKLTSQQQLGKITNKILSTTTSTALARGFIQRQGQLQDVATSEAGLNMLKSDFGISSLKNIDLSKTNIPVLTTGALLTQPQIIQQLQRITPPRFGGFRPFKLPIPTIPGRGQPERRSQPRGSRGSTSWIVNNKVQDLAGDFFAKGKKKKIEEFI